MRHVFMFNQPVKFTLGSGQKAPSSITDPATGKVYPIPAGGSTNDPPANDPPAEDPPVDDPPTNDPPADDPPAARDEPLGEPGKRALEQERSARKEAERELAQLREQQMTEQEKAIEKARKEAATEARTEALSEANKRLFRAEIKAAAAGKVADPDLLSDPDVAMRLLGLGEVPVTGDGDVDAEAISAALDKLVESKPYLAASATRPVGDADQGVRGNGETSTDMNALLRAAVRGE